MYAELTTPCANLYSKYISYAHVCLYFDSRGGRGGYGGGGGGRRDNYRDGGGSGPDRQFHGGNRSRPY